MDASEFETLVTELETRVDRLRSLYEQYFMGIEKQIPAVPHKDVERRIQALRREQPRNTGMRFRFQMIIQRYNTFQSYWQRICREIEEGTYKRHIIRAKKKFGGQPKQEPAAAVAMPAPEPGRTASGSYLLDLDAELEEYVSEPPPPPRVAPAPIVIPQAKPLWRKAVPKPAPAPAPAPEPPVAKAPAPKPAPKAAPVVEKKPGDVSDDRMRQLYAQYVQTKRAHNESTAKVTFADLAKTIRESTDKLREKHAGKKIDFEVTVKDGKTVLKPVVK